MIFSALSEGISIDSFELVCEIDNGIETVLCKIL